MNRKYMGNCAVYAAVAVLSVAIGRARRPADQGQHGQAQHKMIGSMTDAEFVPMMTQHHQHGIEMARAEEELGSSATVKSLAGKIRQSQERDIAELKRYSPETAAAATGGAEHETRRKMMEQESQTVVNRLKSASGDAVDHAFLEELAKHHEMAIDMFEHTKFRNAGLRSLSQRMAGGQRQELDELKKLQKAHTPSK